jgi:hypothetical protein
LAIGVPFAGHDRRGLDHQIYRAGCKA